MLLLQWTIFTGFRFGTRRHHIVSSSRHANCRTLVSISFLLATSCRRVSKSNSSTYKSLVTAFLTPRYSQNKIMLFKSTDAKFEIQTTNRQSDTDTVVKNNCFGSSNALEKLFMGFLTRYHLCQSKSQSEMFMSCISFLAPAAICNNNIISHRFTIPVLCSKMCCWANIIQVKNNHLSRVTRFVVLAIYIKPNITPGHLIIHVQGIINQCIPRIIDWQ